MLRFVKSAAVILFITLLIMSFQNCSPSQNTGLLGSKSSGEPLGTNSIDAPFAFDLVADTISYNSCAGENLNDQGIHGIKIGVNEGFVDSNGTGAVEAGVKLRTDFLQFIGTNVRPIYPSTVVTPAQIQYVLQNSDANRNAFVQFAVRKRSDLTVHPDIIRPIGQVQLSLPRDGIIEGANLTNDPVLTYLTKNVQFTDSGTILTEGPRIYNLYDVSSPRSLEASFGYSNTIDETQEPDTSTLEKFGLGEWHSENTRLKFNSGGIDKIILAQSYGDPTSGAENFGINNPTRKASADNSRAYGRGYALRFEAPGTPAGWRHRQSLLRSVTETNLADGTPASGASWSCESFVITKQTHWNNTKLNEAACVPLIASDLQNASIAAKVLKIRRHYSDSQWDIGLFYAPNEAYNTVTRTSKSICLSPKKTECYLPTNIGFNSATQSTVDVGINYSLSSECYVYPHSVFGITYSAGSDLDTIRRLGRCAQFASVCIR